LTAWSRLLYPYLRAPARFAGIDREVHIPQSMHVDITGAVGSRNALKPDDWFGHISPSRPASETRLR